MLSDLTEKFDLVLKVSLDGQSLEDAAEQIRWFLLLILAASMAEVQLDFQEGLQICRLWVKNMQQSLLLLHVTALPAFLAFH